jgi:5-dehydro-4-deoxyglucarate dehydratase
MTSMTPHEVARTIGQGLLTFPVTHFDAEHRFDETPFREHRNRMLSHDVAALFAAGGTGEFFSLTLAEVDRIVQAAVEETTGKVPVIAGAGTALRSRSSSPKRLSARAPTESSCFHLIS